SARPRPSGSRRSSTRATRDACCAISPGSPSHCAGRAGAPFRSDPERARQTAMLVLEKPADLTAYVGKEICISEWFTVDQAMIDKFADATGDHQWIHVDVERAKREMPGGKTIAHGFLTLSLVPRMNQTIYRVEKRSRGLNYGSNRVRFTGPVPAG